MFAKGGLGNQLFQLNALYSAMNQGEFGILVGFDEMPRNLNLGRFLRIQAKTRRVRKLLRAIGQRVERISRHAAKAGVFSSIQFEGGMSKVIRHKGIIPLTVFYGDFFQDIEQKDLNEGFCRILVSFLALPTNVASNQSTNNLQPRAEGANCFVHVRRGDYVDWPKGHVTALPMAWFLEQMDRIAIDVPSVRFVIFSDDSKFIEENFSGYQNCLIAPRVNNWGDLGKMIEMPYGILSPSTFSWWAAALHRFHFGGGRFIGPKGWTNWHGRFGGGTYPRMTTFLELKPVNEVK